MAETKYIRTFTTTCNTDLIDAINADVNITPLLLQIINDPVNSPGISDFWFDAPLTTTEEQTFDNILNTWSCPTGGVGGQDEFNNAIVYTFSREQLSSLTWLAIGDVTSSTVGYTIPFNATIIGYSYHIENGGNRDINLYVNGTFLTTLTNVSPGDFFNTSLNININANDRIQLRAGTGGGQPTRSVVFSLYIKWQ